MIHEIYITDYLTKAAVDPLALIQRLLSELPIMVRADWQLLTEAPTRILLEELQQPLQNRTAKHSQVAAVLSRVANRADAMPRFCLLPVHLNLQRDTYSLQGIVPLPHAVYDQLTLQIQQHFDSDFALFSDPERRFWWVQPHMPLDANCPWPQDALFQLAFAWQPDGAQASVIRQWTNELQMLLHQLSGLTTENEWPEKLNSLWFASTMKLLDWQHDFDMIEGQGDIYHALNKSGLTCLQSDRQPTITNKISKSLYVADAVSQIDWKRYAEMISRREFSAFKITVPFAERSLCLILKRKHLWQFWRKPLQVEVLLKHLQPQSG